MTTGALVMGKPLTLRLTAVLQGACLIALVQSSIITKPPTYPPSPVLSPCSDVDISDHDLENLRCNICNNNKILLCLSKIIEAIKRRDQGNCNNVIVPPCGCGLNVHLKDYNHGHQGHHGDHHLVHHEQHGPVDHLGDHQVHYEHQDEVIDHGEKKHHGEIVHHGDHHKEHHGEYQEGHNFQEHHEGHHFQHQLEHHQLENHGLNHQAHYDNNKDHNDHHHGANYVDHGEHHKTHYKEDIHTPQEGKIEKEIEKTTSHVIEESKSEATKIDTSSSSEDVSKNHGSSHTIHKDHDSELSGYSSGEEHSGSKHINKAHVSSSATASEAKHSSDVSKELSKVTIDGNATVVREDKFHKDAGLFGGNKHGHINFETATKHDKNYSSNNEIASMNKTKIDESSSSSTVHSKSIADTTKVNSDYLKGVSTEHKEFSEENTEVEKEKHVDVSESTVSHSETSSSELEAVKAYEGKSIVAHDTTIGIEGHHEHYQHEDHHGHHQRVDLHQHHQHVNHHGHQQHVDHHGHHHEHDQHLDLHGHNQQVYQGGHQENYSNDHHGISDVIVNTSSEVVSTIVEGVSTIGGAMHVDVGDNPVPEIIIHDSHKPDYVEIPSQHTHTDYVDQGTEKNVECDKCTQPVNTDLGGSSAVPIVPNTNQQYQPIFYPYYELPPYFPGPASRSLCTQTGIVTPDGVQQHLKPNFCECSYPWILYSLPPVHPYGNIHHEFVVHHNCSHEQKFPVCHGIPDQHIWTGNCFENMRTLILSPPCNQDINCQKITRHVSHNLGGGGTTNSKCITNIVSKQIKN